jgi:hypothetical protein
VRRSSPRVGAIPTGRPAGAEAPSLDGVDPGVNAAGTLGVVRLANRLHEGAAALEQGTLLHLEAAAHQQHRVASVEGHELAHLLELHAPAGHGQRREPCLRLRRGSGVRRRGAPACGGGAWTAGGGGTRSGGARVEALMLLLLDP